jgi:hypothetical protein
LAIASPRYMVVRRKNTGNVVNPVPTYHIQDFDITGFSCMLGFSELFFP